MNKPESNNTALTDSVSVGLATATALLGGFRAFANTTFEKALDDTTLKYFAVAGALLLLRKIKSLSFGDYKAEFQEIKETAEQAVEVAKTAESMARTMPGTLIGNTPLAKAAQAIVPGPSPDDPWKGQFGGKSEANSRRLRAEVTGTSVLDEWFLVRLVVESTDSQKPLEGTVQFFIHDSFPNPRPTVEVVGGIAELRLTSFGAFTVGVLADNGATRLELDLSDDRSFPRKFRER